MEYQEHLLKYVFGGDKERFDKAWRQALDEGCKDAVSWNALVGYTLSTADTFSPKSITKMERLPYDLTELTYHPSRLFSIEKTQTLTCKTSLIIKG